MNLPKYFSTGKDVLEECKKYELKLKEEGVVKSIERLTAARSHTEDLETDLFKPEPE